MRNAFACWITMLAAWSVPAPVYSQQLPGKSVSIYPTSCDDLAGLCAEIVPADWDLADLPAASAPDDLTRPADGNLSMPILDGSRYRLVRDENEAHQVTGVTGGESEPQRWTDHVPREYATHRGFLKQAGAIKTETLLFLGYFSLQSGKKLFRENTHFHFHDEGWFGKDRSNLGIDKLTHAFDTYLIAEILHMRLHEVSNASEGDALTAGILASALMAFNELSDGIEPDSGFSMQDIAMNIAGAGFSVLRNTVPGLKEKVAFKIEIVPNDNVYSYRGQKHYEQQRYMFSIKGAGFKELEKTPLRFVDLQIGYYGSDFLLKRRQAGIEPKRHLFLGLGLNLGEILFGKSRSKVGKVAYTVLDYFQPPYTSLRYDTTGHVGN